MKPEYFGAGALERIPSILESRRANRIFLVTGKKSFETSGARDAIAPLLKGKTVIRFHEFSVNPKIDDVKKGVARLREADSDFVIAVGGGSVIDMAKLINALAHNDGNPENVATGKAKIKVKGRPLMAVPTTAGSGSEATHFAVVYVNDVKYSLAHEYILPDYPVVDPSLTYNLSPGLTAVSGFDALSQAVESYWSVAATEESQGYASRAIKMVLPALEPAVNSPGKEVRDAMSLAAHLAGKAINLTTTTAPHAISYPMTTYFGIPHGHAVALLLGKFFDINSRVGGVAWNDPRGRDHVQKTMRDLFSLLGCPSPADCAEKWYALMAAVGLATDLGSLGIRSQSDIDIIVSNVNVQRVVNNPVLITEDILKQLFRLF